MLNKLVGSTGIGIVGGGGTGSLYIDKEDDNYGIGETLTFHTDATDNIAIGEEALNSTDGVATYNVGIGTLSLTNVTTGDHNIGIGYLTGTNLSTESDCVLIGGEAGDAITSGADGTVAIGKSTLGALTSGAQNTAIGYNAGKTATTGASNVYIGYAVADDVHIDSTSNVAIGLNAFGGSHSGSASNENIAIGNNALGAGVINGVTGTVAIGSSALTALTTGTGNVAIGYLASTDITTGAYNTVVGYEALTNAQTAVSGTTAIGYRAGYKLGDDGVSDHSDYNTIVGYLAMGGGHDTVAGNTANGNTAIGYRAAGGSTNTSTDITATNLVAVGLGAMSVISSGYSNIAVGRDAGDTLTTGSLNVCVGTSSNVSASGAVGQTAIGHEVTASQNYETVIGIGSVFKFISKEYTCDHADAEDGKSAASEASPLKIPAYSIIKSISVIVSTLSNLGTYNVSLYHSSDTAAPADDTALGGTPVEVLGAGVATTMSGNSASAVDIALGSGTILKQTYYNDWDGEHLGIGTADRYIHVGQAGTGNGDTDPSTAGVIKVLVEYVGLD